MIGIADSAENLSITWRRLTPIQKALLYQLESETRVLPVMLTSLKTSSDSPAMQPKQKACMAGCTKRVVQVTYFQHLRRLWIEKSQNRLRILFTQVCAHTHMTNNASCDAR